MSYTHPYWLIIPHVIQKLLFLEVRKSNFTVLTNRWNVLIKVTVLTNYLNSNIFAVKLNMPPYTHHVHEIILVLRCIS